MGRIKFTVSGAKNPLSKGKIIYSGKVRHIDTIRGKRLWKEQHRYTQLNPVYFKSMMNCICEYVAHELACGNDVDLGPFKVTSRIQGGFPSPTAPFDPKQNQVVVKVLPGLMLKKALKKAMADELPENITDTTVAR